MEGQNWLFLKCICVSVDITLNPLSAHKTLESSLCDSQRRHPPLSPAGSIFIWSVSSYGVRSAGWSNRHSGLLFPERRVQGRDQEPLSEPRWWPLNHDHGHLAKFSRESRTTGSAYRHTHTHKNIHTRISLEGNPKQREQKLYTNWTNCTTGVEQNHYQPVGNCSMLFSLSSLCFGSVKQFPPHFKLLRSATAVS